MRVIEDPNHWKPSARRVASRYVAAKYASRIATSTRYASTKPWVFKWFPRINMVSILDENDESKGYLRVVEELPLPELLGTSQCPEELTVLYEKHGAAPVWKGWMTEVDYNLRGQGFGLKLYETAIAELRRKHPGGFYFIPSRCGKKGEGSTTGAGARVWRSLARKYSSEGSCLWVG